LNVSDASLLLVFLCRDGGRPSSASIFVGGFVLGGIIVGALGCVYAPQVLPFSVISYLWCRNSPSFWLDFV